MIVFEDESGNFHSSINVHMTKPWFASSTDECTLTLSRVHVLSDG